MKKHYFREHGSKKLDKSEKTKKEAVNKEKEYSYINDAMESWIRPLENVEIPSSKAMIEKYPCMVMDVNQVSSINSTWDCLWVLALTAKIIGTNFFEKKLIVSLRIFHNNQRDICSSCIK